MALPFETTSTELDSLLTPRDSLVRKLVDPNRTLPNVEVQVFEKEDRPESFAREKTQIYYNGTEMGYCDLITSHQQGRMHFDSITLDSTDRTSPRHETPHRDRPKGIGLATYLLAIETSHERGLPFYSQEGALTIASNRIWEILVACGAAEVVEAPRLLEYPDENKVLASYMATAK